MIVMQESGHSNQKKTNNRLEGKQNQGTNQAETKREVSIKEVVTLLNENSSIEDIAQKLGLRVNVLEAKLANAAIILNDEGQWRYIGSNKIESLSRNIYSKIYVKPFDKEFVKSQFENVKVVKEPVTDLDYELYKNSLNIKNPIDKKSVLFEVGLYNELKEISQKKSIKISNLINTLIEKGLEYYELR